MLHNSLKCKYTADWTQSEHILMLEKEQTKLLLFLFWFMFIAHKQLFSDSVCRQTQEIMKGKQQKYVELLQVPHQDF